MKKLLMVICLAAASTTLVNAQGGGGQGGGARMAEAMKQRMKEELKFSDQKIDSVMAVQMEFQQKSRQLRTNESLSDDQRREAMKAFNEQRKARLKNSLTDAEIQQLEAYNEKMRANRPGGGGRPGGNN